VNQNQSINQSILGGTECINIHGITVFLFSLFLVWTDAQNCMYAREFLVTEAYQLIMINNSYYYFNHLYKEQFLARGRFLFTIPSHRSLHIALGTKK